MNGRASPPGWGQGGIRRSLTLVTSLVNIVLELHRGFRVEGRAWRSARHQAARVGDGRGHAAFRTQLSGPPHAAKHLAGGLAIRTVSLFEDCNPELPQWAPSGSVDARRHGVRVAISERRILEKLSQYGVKCARPRYTTGQEANGESLVVRYFCSERRRPAKGPNAAKSRTPAVCQCRLARAPAP